MLKTLAALSCLAIAFTTASRAGGVSDAVITKLYVSKQYPDILFVLVDKPKDTTPACHANGSWTFVMPLTSELDKKMYAMLLAARASQTPVSLDGIGICDTFGSIESLSGIRY